MELFAQAIGGAVLLLCQLIVQPGQLAQPDRHRLIELDQVEAVHIGAQRVSQNVRIAAVVLGSSRRIAVAEPVQLLGVDGKHGKTVLQKCFHDGPARALDGPGQGRSRIRCLLSNPVRKLRQTIAAVFDPSFRQSVALAVHQTNAVPLRAPIDPQKILKVVGQVRTSSVVISTCRVEYQSLYWRSVAGRELPTGSSPRTTASGRRSTPGARLALG